MENKLWNDIQAQGNTLIGCPLAEDIDLNIIEITVYIKLPVSMYGKRGKIYMIAAAEMRQSVSFIN